MVDNNMDVEKKAKNGKQAENSKNQRQVVEDARNDEQTAGNNDKQQAPVSFFHPSLKAVRRRVFLQWIRTSKYTGLQKNLLTA